MKWKFVALIFCTSSLYAQTAQTQQHLGPQMTAYKRTPIYTRHYTVTRPYFVSEVEADTDNPSFSVFKISGQTFDAHNDYNEKKYHTAVKLWASNGKSKSYVYFSDNQRGPQVIQCSSCPVFEKIDGSNYRIKY